MNIKIISLVALLATMMGACASISDSKKLPFPIEEGKLIPKEKAIEFVKANLPDVDEKGAQLYSVEGSSIQKALIQYRYKGEKARHYGYYGLTVDVRQFRWPAEKGKPFALVITGTAGPDTLPGRRIYWFDSLATAKDVATALVALGAKSAP